jgi:DNA polymerase-1
MSGDFQFPLTNCTQCPLSGRFGRGYEGDIDKADVILLGEAPGKFEQETGLPFQGVAGQLLRRVLKKHNFPFERAILTNPILCKPPENKTNTAMLKACKNNMYALINAVQPKFIVLMGNVPLQALLGKKGITKHRGSTIEMNNAQVFPIFHPSYINRKAGDKDLERVFDKDIEFICNKINGTHEEEVKDLHYFIVDSLEEFKKMWDHIYRTKIVSIDLETTGLRHWQNKIRSIQFSPEEKWAYYVPILEHKESCLHLDGVEIEDVSMNGKPRKTTLFPYWKSGEDLVIWESIHQILKDPEILKCGQNFKFDMKFLLHYLEPNNYDAEIKGFSFDTIFAFYLHNENSPNDLKTNSYLHFRDLRGYAQDVQSKMSDKDEEESDWTKIKLESLAPYGCGDADATLRLANLYSNKFFKTEEHAASMLQLFYNFYMPLSTILTKAERVGCGLDVPKLKKVKIKYEKEKAEIEDEILIMAGKETDAVVRQRILAIRSDLSEERLAVKIKSEKFNLNSPQQLSKLLFEDMKLPILKKTDTGMSSTDKETLKILAIDYPFCRKIVKYRNRVKMISTYFDGAMKELEPEGTIVKGFPMVHFTCNLIGTISGRGSYRRYPIQTTPREVDVRSIICAPPGYYLVEWDLVQIELMLAAWYSQDPVMLEGYKNNIDIHLETLKFMSGKSHEELMELKKTDLNKFKELRKRAKGYNFGGLYLGGSETLASHINEKLEEGEVKVTVEEAQAHINYFFGKYQSLKIFYDILVDSAVKRGYIKSCYNRIRRFPILTVPYQEGMKKEVAEAKRQVSNNMIQGTASDITKYSMIDLYNYIQQNNMKSIISFDVHDAMLALVKEEELKEIVIKGREFMEKERPPIMRESIEIKAEVEVFRNWKIPISEEELKSRGLKKEDLG